MEATPFDSDDEIIEEIEYVEDSGELIEEYYYGSEEYEIEEEIFDEVIDEEIIDEEIIDEIIDEEIIDEEIIDEEIIDEEIIDEEIIEEIFEEVFDEEILEEIIEEHVIEDQEGSNSGSQSPSAFSRTQFKAGLQRSSYSSLAQIEEGSSEDHMPGETESRRSAANRYSNGLVEPELEAEPATQADPEPTPEPVFEPKKPEPEPEPVPEPEPNFVEIEVNGVVYRVLVPPALEEKRKAIEEERQEMEQEQMERERMEPETNREQGGTLNEHDDDNDDGDEGEDDLGDTGFAEQQGYRRLGLHQTPMWLNRAREESVSETDEDDSSRPWGKNPFKGLPDPTKEDDSPAFLKEARALRNAKPNIEANKGPSMEGNVKTGGAGSALLGTKNYCQPIAEEEKTPEFMNKKAGGLRKVEPKPKEEKKDPDFMKKAGGLRKVEKKKVQEKKSIPSFMSKLRKVTPKWMKRSHQEEKENPPIDESNDSPDMESPAEALNESESGYTDPMNYSEQTGESMSTTKVDEDASSAIVRTEAGLQDDEMMENHGNEMENHGNESGHKAVPLEEQHLEPTLAVADNVENQSTVYMDSQVPPEEQHSEATSAVTEEVQNQGMAQESVPISSHLEEPLGSFHIEADPGKSSATVDDSATGADSSNKYHSSLTEESGTAASPQIPTGDVEDKGALAEQQQQGDGDEKWWEQIDLKGKEEDAWWSMDPEEEKALMRRIGLEELTKLVDSLFEDDLTASESKNAESKNAESKGVQAKGKKALDGSGSSGKNADKKATATKADSSERKEKKISFREKAAARAAALAKREADWMAAEEGKKKKSKDLEDVLKSKLGRQKKIARVSSGEQKLLPSVPPKKPANPIAPENVKKDEGQLGLADVLKRKMAANGVAPPPKPKVTKQDANVQEEEDPLAKFLLPGGDDDEADEAPKPKPVVNEEQKKLEWEKPSWTKARLKPTVKGAKVRKGRNLANPITFPKREKAINEGVEEDEQEETQSKGAMVRGAVALVQLPKVKKHQKNLNFTVQGARIRDGRKIEAPINNKIRAKEEVKIWGADPEDLKLTPRGFNARLGKRLGEKEGITMATQHAHFEKPKWTKAKLHSTDKGEALKEGEALSSPITKATEEKKYGFEKPSWTQKALKSTGRGADLKGGATLSQPITHVPKTSVNVNFKANPAFLKTTDAGDKVRNGQNLSRPITFPKKKF